WRDRIQEDELAQPFKQSFREVYLLTPAEETTGTYSNRFAAHIVRTSQVRALARSRRWDLAAMGPWDGGFEGTARRPWAHAGLVAELHLELVEDGGMDPTTGLGELASTDQVRFVPIDAP